MLMMSQVKVQRPPFNWEYTPSVVQEHLPFDSLVNNIDNAMKNASDDLRLFDESHVAIIVPYRNHVSGFSSQICSL